MPFKDAFCQHSFGPISLPAFYNSSYIGFYHSIAYSSNVKSSRDVSARTLVIVFAVNRYM
jgi:hypothetical protein